MNNFKEEINKFVKRKKAKRVKEKREDEIFWREFKQAIPSMLVLSKRYIFHIFIWLTQYFPFSLLSTLTWRNYQNREVYQAYCAIWDAEYLTGIYFNVEEFYKDDNFIFFKGKFERVTKNSSSKLFIERLEKILGGGSIYLCDIEKGMQLLKINREVVLNRKYYSFIYEK